MYLVPVGLWGVVATGLFSDPELIALIRDKELDRGTQFGVQVCFADPFLTVIVLLFFFVRTALKT